MTSSRTSPPFPPISPSYSMPFCPTAGSSPIPSTPGPLTTSVVVSERKRTFANPRGSPDAYGKCIFQHRNMRKWNLSDNAVIPDFLYESDCHNYLDRLRQALDREKTHMSEAEKVA